MTTVENVDWLLFIELFIWSREAEVDQSNRSRSCSWHDTGTWKYIILCEYTLFLDGKLEQLPGHPAQAVVLIWIGVLHELDILLLQGSVAYMINISKKDDVSSAWNAR